jgi:hypothetical protein
LSGIWCIFLLLIPAGIHCWVRDGDSERHPEGYVPISEEERINWTKNRVAVHRKKERSLLV